MFMAWFIVLRTLNRQVKIYTIYNISVTHKVLKSCRSKIATLAHDVCDVHGERQREREKRNKLY